MLSFYKDILLLTCSGSWVIVEGDQDPASKFSITGKKFYVTVVSFSTKDNTDLLQILNSELIYWIE